MPYFTRGVEDTSVPLGPVKTIDPTVQPVAVEDVAKAFVSAIGNEKAYGETYNLVGPDRATWPQMLTWIRDTNTHVVVTRCARAVEPCSPRAIVADVAAAV